MITAGGTGGHVYPGLAVARALIAQGIPVVWMGTRKGLEARVIPEAGIEMAWLDVNGLRGKGWQTLLLAPVNLMRALWQSVQIMRTYKPAAVLGMGGFVAGPGGLMAALLGTPVVIHEQNAVAGLTNKLLSRFCRRVLEGFPGTFASSQKVMATGNPVRLDIASLSAPLERLADRDDQPVHILVVGGSLGAQALNQIVPQALAQFATASRPVVRHQAGVKNIDAARSAYAAAAVDAEVMPFIEDMAEAYAWADLVICRSGALTIAELAATGVAALLVPYPYAVDDHQTANAKYLADNGAALLLQQRDLTADTLAGVLKALCADRAQLRQMSVASRALAKPHATAQVAAICAAYAGYDFNNNAGKQQ
ncbi:undecaprenyldiphospho-muramoylpentapeptide beta-N-acetylglucosaminyltransferase [Thiothrix fructosivorans]|jgi:UDP-N-acetylglucosamine--N-acetylmuramyl-(pentapeptide) pyrophosphoryl-undecaprenol N-acetylglucosamine transferase|uniref:UDP-N-acetylglucosamine--N-acetylmuramyl-(pentapeptide) pyrophosphoryl-undecaprenol N-acetylglucosamine transferase n=2 Tax=Thiothrix fructosivorans TaxID=111770 RepID=A0A8B0SNC3_9GAMM|nr:undecaprenyldiphospho-muramoylpentapeptide beta-N-acetylglucosaminyltransferase [Thiothrix fructosivorans]QTX12826.1 undecaprenyldiphospho-muramoylpentapeptide beta-N-acetylglucosaminyltransferase [Thiothrix fructosivorans]